MYIYICIYIPHIYAMLWRGFMKVWYTYNNLWSFWEGTCEFWGFETTIVPPNGMDPATETGDSQPAYP